MSTKVEQNHPAQPLSSWASQKMVEGYYEEEYFGFSKREAVFLEFMSKLIAVPEQFDSSLVNRANKAKKYTNQYFKTLEEWNNE